MYITLNECCTLKFLHLFSSILYFTSDYSNILLVCENKTGFLQNPRAKLRASSAIDALDFTAIGSDNNQLCRGKKAAGSIGRRIPWCFARGKFDSFFQTGCGRERTPTSPTYFTQSFPGNGNNFYYLGISRIESREKKNEDRAAEEARAREYSGGRQRSRERKARSRVRQFLHCQ